MFRTATYRSLSLSSLGAHRQLSLNGTSAVGTRCQQHFFSTVAPGKVYTGRVLFYNRQKCYGFVVPNESPDLQVFVHRSNIISHLSPTELPNYPYLNRDERISFSISWNEPDNNDKGGPVAKEIMFANRKPIPPLRRNWLTARHRAMRTKLGDKVFNIMRNQDLSDEQKWSEVQRSMVHAEIDLKDASELIERCGMSEEDFAVEEEPKPNAEEEQNSTMV